MIAADGSKEGDSDSVNIHRLGRYAGKQSLTQLTTNLHISYCCHIPYKITTEFGDRKVTTELITRNTLHDLSSRYVTINRRNF
jgi:hypothetical protein